VAHALDRTAFPARDKNDHAGAPAFAPAVLPQSILLASSRGS
jgi:hypothetical protein